MKKTIFFLFILGLFVNAYSQEALWSHNYPADISSSNFNVKTQPKIFPESDNIFKVIGRTKTAIGTGLAVLRYDISGGLVSEQIFNDEPSSNHIVDYKLDDLGHLYIISVQSVNINKTKIVLRKYALSGNLIWEQEIQDTGYFSYHPFSISFSENNTIFIQAIRYIVDYGTVYDPETTYRLFAYDINGNQLWERTFAVPTIDYFVHNNEIYLMNYPQYNPNLIKVNTDNIITLDILPNLQDYQLKNIYLAQDNNLLITSTSNYSILKMDLEGNVMWSEDYSCSENSFARTIKSLIQDEEDNIYITGICWKETYGGDLQTLKIEGNGNLLWSNIYLNRAFTADNVMILKNGYIYIGGKELGTESSEYLVLKIDTQTGNFSGRYKFEVPVGENVYITSIYAFEDNKIALTGLIYNGTNDNWMTQLLTENSFSVGEPNYLEDIKLYPNPLDENQVLSIEGEHLTTFAVYSLTGQMLQQGKFGEGSFHTIQLQNLSKGVYLLKLNNDKQTLTKKIVIR